MTTTEIEMGEIIADALYTIDEDDDLINDVDTFDAHGILTTNNGIVVRMKDGSEFQVTIKQSR